MKQHPRRWSGALLALTLVLGTAAGAAPAGDVTLRDLAGAWTATGIVYRSAVRADVAFDARAELGMAVTVEVTPDGRYGMVIALTDLEPERLEGAVDVARRRIRVENMEFTLELTRDRLRLTAPVTFDFHESGHEEPAVLEVVFRRG